MASKKGKAAPADDDFEDLFEGIPGQSANPKSSKQGAAGSKGTADKDVLADIESQLAAEQISSRPHTPRLKETGLKRPTGTPPIVDDKATRKSTDSSRSLRASFTPSATSSDFHDFEKKAPEAQPEQSGGGWWGGILSTASATASAAMKQAEAAYKEIQQNEEAQKWADQVRGLKGIDVGTLKSYGKPHDGTTDNMHC